ncbi:sensor domain-containing diguanylate cyclase [Luteimonas terrae]|uniref:Diguanylate cyclase (GGDEF)-like protein/PAS domain S-box-containing protein n=1 Tax=Luteimonas terrae TaxID=1530191 RepID=A0ABU1Y0X1_9GAMM|nr:sensor domain-containing diguanylate cyclase [Luteimonas terrae]MDR7194603.1 diguanylate cyclase (GGDEF)-like protein/PAS domain S-box-containing protein [Luteimonas terrae]
MTPKLPIPADILDLLPDAVCVVDQEGRYLFVSAGFERILGYRPADVLGRQAFDFIHPDDRSDTRQQAAQVMEGMAQRHFRNRYLHSEGHAVDMQWSANWHPAHGVRIGVGREVTELRRVERELEHLAAHDVLTGLPNRYRLQQTLEQALAQARASGDGLALLYVDLDGFKTANDLGGHDAGDRLLQDVATRLTQSLRHGDVAARVGGDEFVILLPACRDAAAARQVADTLRGQLRLVYRLSDRPFQLDASIGIACFPGDGSDAATLLAHADREMYAVKRRVTRGNAA